MLWVPQKGRLRVETNWGTVGTDTPGTSVTTGASASTKGSVAELITSSTFDTYLIYVWAINYFSPATDSELMVDLLVAGSTEEVLISNLIFGGAGQFSGMPRGYLFPVYVPSSTRFAAQAAGDRVSTAFRVGIGLYGGDAIPHFRVGRKVTTYGTGTVPAGTTITPGASGAAGSFTQITASTSEDHFALHAGFQGGLDTTKNNRTYYYCLGLGAATEEELPGWFLGQGSQEDATGPIPSLPVFADVPSGTRIAMRASNSGTNDSGNYNGVVYGIS